MFLCVLAQRRDDISERMRVAVRCLERDVEVRAADPVGDRAPLLVREVPEPEEEREAFGQGDP